MYQQQLMEGLEEFFQSSYPDSQSIIAVSYQAPTIDGTGIIPAKPLNVNTIIKLILVGGLIFIVYQLANHSSKKKMEEDNKQYYQSNL